MTVQASGLCAQGAVARLGILQRLAESVLLPAVVLLQERLDSVCGLNELGDRRTDALDDWLGDVLVALLRVRPGNVPVDLLQGLAVIRHLLVGLDREPLRHGADLRQGGIAIGDRPVSAWVPRLRGSLDAPIRRDAPRLLPLLPELVHLLERVLRVPDHQDLALRAHERLPRRVHQALQGFRARNVERVCLSKTCGTAGSSIDAVRVDFFVWLSVIDSSIALTVPPHTKTQTTPINGRYQLSETRVVQDSPRANHGR